RSLIFEKIPFFVLSGASSTITFIVQRSGGAIKTTDELSFGIRLANAFISYIRYIHKMLWPSRLVMFYPYPEGTLPIRQILGAIVLLCAVTALVLWLGRRHKYLLVGWLWYLGILAPVIGLVQVGNQAMADRYSYVSIIGLFVIVAWLLPTSFATGTCRKFILALSAGIILSVLTVCTGFQIRHWRNSIALFRHALESTDNNYIAHCCIAEPLRQSGYLDGAIFHNKEALRIRPDYLEAHNGLAIALFEKGYPSEAITHFSKALQIDPGFVEARGNLASALARQGRFEEAVSQYRKALELMPDNATIHNGIGVALGKVGQYDQAIFHFRRALQINPDFSDARNNLTYTLSRQRKAR
ncbi:MAG: tetratricopeptide repeat protein, partial [Sedimentisphaerales bacterium]|nr:tetratricopeptide repeat protein [Sedimentisphaerales bacterium]